MTKKIKTNNMSKNFPPPNENGNMKGISIRYR